MRPGYYKSSNFYTIFLSRQHNCLPIFLWMFFVQKQFGSKSNQKLQRFQFLYQCLKSPKRVYPILGDICFCKKSGLKLIIKNCNSHLATVVVSRTHSTYTKLTYHSIQFVRHMKASAPFFKVKMNVVVFQAFNIAIRRWADAIVSVPVSRAFLNIRGRGHSSKNL